MVNNKRKVGRPLKKEEDKAKYKRIAIYPKTYTKIKEESAKNNKNMIDVIDEKF